MDARTRSASAPPAPLEALRAMGRTLNELACVRGSLFAQELREEVQRRKAMLVLGAAGLVFLHAALLAAGVLVAVVFWESHRIAAIAGLVLLYLACGAAALARLRIAVSSSPAPFAATLGEIEHDLAELRRAP